MKKLVIFILVSLLAFAFASCDGMMNEGSKDESRGNVSKNDVSAAVSDTVSRGDSLVSDAVSTGDSLVSDAVSMGGSAVSDVVSGAEGLVSDVVSALS